MLDEADLLMVGIHDFKVHVTTCIHVYFYIALHAWDTCTIFGLFGFLPSCQNHMT